MRDPSDTQALFSKNSASTSLRLRGMTYNIRRCQGRDERTDVDRVAAVIRSAEVHVVGLQEVEAPGGAPPEQMQSRRLGELLGMEGVGQPLFVRKGNWYGNGLLTSLPIISTVLHRFESPSREPRGAIDALLWLGDNMTLRVLVTHFGLTAKERSEQSRSLFAEVLPAMPGYPTLFLGDVNEWRPWGGAAQWLRRCFGPTARPASFPSGRPFLALDRVAFRPSGGLQRVYAVRTTAAKWASDHLPVVGEVAFDGLCKEQLGEKP